MSKGNEPAYPVPVDPHKLDAPGLTKRELFAAMAMKGLLANPHYAKQLEGGDVFQGSPAQAARYHADALLAELEQTP